MVTSVRGTTDSSVAVIGAGPGGLATAMLLAASGLRVRVYEAADHVGGRTGRVRIPPVEGRSPVGAFSADRGPTFFLMPYVLEEIFSASGRRLGDYVDLRRLDPMYRLVMGRSGQSPITVDATQDVREMSRRLAAVEPADGAAFDRFISDNRVKLRLMEPVLRSPMRSAIDVVKSASPKFLPHLNAHLSVAGLLERYFKNPYVRLAVSFQSKYLGMSPMECPSIFTILPFIEYEYGIWHPIGGCAALSDAMADACREMGVEIRTGEPVTGLEFDRTTLTGIRTARGVEHHDHAVVNADAAAALKRLVPADLLRRVPGFNTPAAIDAKRYSCSTYMLYLGIEGRADLPHHTIYISSKYEDNLKDITTRGTLSEDPSVYVCNPTPIDPTLAPEGCSSLYVLMPTPNTRDGRSIDWKGRAGEIRATVLSQLERRLGISGIERRIIAENVVTPDDWASGAHGTGPINHGATFNLAHNLGQMLHKRVQHRLPGVDGLWFVGGGTHPGSGLPGIFLSSQIAARMLCREAGVPFAGDSLRRPAAAPALAGA
jgi:phytoene desaturase